MTIQNRTAHNSLVAKLAELFRDTYMEALENTKVDDDVFSDIEEKITRSYNQVLECKFARGAVEKGLDVFLDINESNIFEGEINKLYWKVEEKIFNLVITYFLEGKNIREDEEIDKEFLIHNSKIFLGQKLKEDTWVNYRLYKLKQVSDKNYRPGRNNRILSFMLALAQNYQQIISEEDESNLEKKEEYIKEFSENIYKMMEIHLAVLEESYGINPPKKTASDNSDSSLEGILTKEQASLSLIRTAQRLLFKEGIDESIFMQLEKYKNLEDRSESVDNVITVEKKEIYDEQKEQLEIKMFIDDNICQTFAENKYDFYSSLEDGLQKLSKLNDIIKNSEEIRIIPDKSELVRVRGGQNREKKLNILSIIVNKKISLQFENAFKQYLEEIFYAYIMPKKTKGFNIEVLSANIREILLLESLDKNTIKKIDRKKI